MPDLQLVDETIEIGPHRLEIARPHDAESLLSEDAFEREEFLPYWAEMWSGGVALAEHVAALDLRGKRIVELGCGLGLPSIAAALGGATVVATDWSPDAIELLDANAARNGLRLDARVVAWTNADGLVADGPFDLIFAADLFYERRNVEQLLELLPRLGREVLVSDPGRPFTKTFLAEAADWQVETVAEKDAVTVRRVFRPA